MPSTKTVRVALCSGLVLVAACSSQTEIGASRSALIGPSNMVVGSVDDVGNDWTTVTLARTYASMVVVATPVYSAQTPPLVTRIRNASADQFEVRVDPFDGQTGPVTPVTVHYLVVEEGVFAEQGLALEAVKYDAATTAGKGNWVGDARTYQQPYTSPVVIGQVMSYNDARPSAFWSYGSKASNPPSAADLHVGRQVAEDPDADRGLETIGYLVLEAGAYLVDGMSVEAFIGADRIKGVDNGTYTYPLNQPGLATSAVLSAAGMDGNNGGWPVLIGPDATTGNALQLAFDEDQVRDSERRHTAEQVAYVAVNPCLPDAVGRSCGAGKFCTAEGRCEACAPGATGEGVVDVARYQLDSTPESLSGLAGAWCITGDLYVKAINLTDLSGLEALTVIGGDLDIRYSSLVSVDGLEGLRHIGGDVLALHNASLQRIDGLGGASMAGDQIWFFDNPELLSIDGLPVPEALDDGLILRDNPLLTDVEPLSALERAGSIVLTNASLSGLNGLRNLETATSLQVREMPVTDVSGLSGAISLGFLQLSELPLADLTGLETVAIGGLALSDMPNLVSFEGANSAGPTLSKLIATRNDSLVDFTGLQNVQLIDGFVTVMDNPSLTSFAGLEQLQGISRNVVIGDNNQLADLSGLGSLQTIDENLTIRSNASLVSLNGLQSLASVTNDVLIRENQLTNLDGLSGLQDVGGSFLLSYETQLTSTAGLTSLRSVGGTLLIGNCRFLTDLGQFPSLESVGSFSIHSNFNLPQCHVTALVARFDVNCHTCRDNELDDPQCTSTLDEMPGMGTAMHRDYGGARLFDEFHANPTYAQTKVERQSNGTIVEMSRSTLEFDIRSLPAGAAVISATLELPTKAVTWGVGNTVGLEVYGYQGDGMMSTEDGLEGEYAQGVLYMDVNEIQTTLDARWLIEDAQSQGHDYLGLNLRLEQEWGAGYINQLVEIYDFGGYEWERPTLTIEWQ
jgi:hypothetical protein